MKRKWLTLLSALLLPLSVDATPTILKIQDVIEMALNKGLYRRDIDLGYQKSEMGLLLSEANFDTQMYLKGQNDDSRLEAPGSFSNNRDRIQTMAFGLNRKFITGTTLGLDYSYSHRDSDLGNFMKAAGMPSIQYYHLTTLSFKQDLLNNFFGYKDQRQYLAADLQFQRSKLEKDEATEELVLQVVKLYLDAYYAQESLKQSTAARDKYLLLLKSVQQKNKMGFDDRSELTKTKAELQNQERNLKSASLAYTNLIRKLYSLLNTSVPEEVVIGVNEQITAPPAKDQKSLPEGLRKARSSELLVQATSADQEAATNNELASLNFFSQAAYSGLDAKNSEALSELNHTAHPKYTVGLEFVMRWGGSAQKADSLAKKIARDEAVNNKLKIQNDLREILERTEQSLQAKYLIAANAQETVKIWEDAVKSQEKNHRFGRITTAELIIDYNTYFHAKATLSGAIADYQMALLEYQAARDELITGTNR